MNYVPVPAFRRIRELELALTKIEEALMGLDSYNLTKVLTKVLTQVDKVLRDSRYDLFECFKCSNLFAVSNMSAKEGRVLCDGCFYSSE